MHTILHPDRKDKFYKKLENLIITLKSQAYEFTDIEDCSLSSACNSGNN